MIRKLAILEVKTVEAELRKTHNNVGNTNDCASSQI